MDRDADTWETLREPAIARVKVERSEFIALAFPLIEEAAFADRLDSVAREYFDATHHCWAWRLFAEGNPRSRSSDAGEPNGTAGKPILSAIESAELFDVAVIVVRYFGGIKLGTGGLTRAYRSAARQVLDEAPRLRKYLTDLIDVRVPFASVSSLYRLIDPPGVVLVSEAYGAENVFTLQVRRSLTERVTKELTEKRLEFVRK